MSTTRWYRRSKVGSTTYTHKKGGRTTRSVSVKTSTSTRTTYTLHRDGRQTRTVVARSPDGSFSRKVKTIVGKPKVSKPKRSSLKNKKIRIPKTKPFKAPRPPKMSKMRSSTNRISKRPSRRRNTSLKEAFYQLMTAAVIGIILFIIL